MSGKVAAARESVSCLPVPNGGTVGLYVHVPFCSTTCDFCAFYQQRPERGDFDRFVDGIERELELVDRPIPAATVFWGGGTPGLLPPESIRRLGQALRQAMAEDPLEWTVELTPGCVGNARLEALREIGVTRISLGAQSFQPRLLDALGRRHPREKIFAAYDLLRRHAFENVNLDLMFALPGQSLDEWIGDLREAVALQPEHLSTYCLTFEEDTALYVKLANGEVTIDEEKEVAFYRTAWNVLGEAGFQQYEVSNYARPNYSCIHNVNTWRMGEWIGLGPAAASQSRGWRSSNPANLSVWLEGLASGIRSTDQVTEVSPELLACDLLIFGLRMNAGIDLGQVEERLGRTLPANVTAVLDQCVEEDLLECEERWIRLTDAGRLVADRIGGEILSAFG